VKLNDLEAKRYNINTIIVVHGQLQGMYEKYNQLFLKMSHQNIIFLNISKENLFAFEKNIFLKISTFIQIIISIKVAMVLLSRV